MKTARAALLSFALACSPAAHEAPRAEVAPTASALPSAPPSASSAPPIAPTACAPGAGPLELHLVLDASMQPTLHLRARNCSDHDVRVVYDQRQRADLLVTTATERAIGKHKSVVENVAPPVDVPVGAEVELDGGLLIAPESGRRTLLFSNRRYALGPGRWRMRARFTSKLAIDGSWVGELTSNEVELDLP